MRKQKVCIMFNNVFIITKRQQRMITNWMIEALREFLKQIQHEV